jgi:hypothetical protein
MRGGGARGGAPVRPRMVLLPKSSSLLPGRALRSGLLLPWGMLERGARAGILDGETRAVEDMEEPKWEDDIMELPSAV